MKILRRYAMKTAEYAYVEMDDGRKIEFKVKGKNVSDQAFLDLAAVFPADPPEPTIPGTSISIILDGRETVISVKDGAKIDIKEGKISDTTKPVEKGKMRCCACGYPFEKEFELKHPQKLFFSKDVPEDITLFQDGNCFFHEKCFAYYSQNPELWMKLNKFALPWPEKI